MPKAYKKIKYEDRLKIQQMCSEGAKPSEMQRRLIRGRKHDGMMDFVLAVMFVALMIFTVVMVVIFCIFQAVPIP